MTIEELAGKLQEIGLRAMREMARVAIEAKKDPIWVVKAQFTATAATLAFEQKQTKSQFLEECELVYESAQNRLGPLAIPPTGRNMSS